jgi:hypothetical protein
MCAEYGQDAANFALRTISVFNLDFDAKRRIIKPFGTRREALMIRIMHISGLGRSCSFGLQVLRIRRVEYALQSVNGSAVRFMHLPHVLLPVAEIPRCSDKRTKSGHRGAQFQIKATLDIVFERKVTSSRLVLSLKCHFIGERD